MNIVYLNLYDFNSLMYCTNSGFAVNKCFCRKKLQGEEFILRNKEIQYLTMHYVLMKKLKKIILYPILNNATGNE